MDSSCEQWGAGEVGDCRDWICPVGPGALEVEGATDRRLQTEPVGLGRKKERKRRTGRQKKHNLTTGAKMLNVHNIGSVFPLEGEEM